MTHYYFAYGANTCNEGMTNRCPSATHIGKALLLNYRMCFRRHADIQEDTSSKVEGVLWQISDSDLEYLDRFEGYPEYYTRRQVEIHHRSNTVIAWVYIMNDQTFEFRPNGSYLCVCLSGYDENCIDTSQIFNALTNS